MSNSNLIYGVKDKPGLWKTIVFAFQQVLAILAATIVVPVIINGKTGSDYRRTLQTAVDSNGKVSIGVFGTSLNDPKGY